MHERNIYKTPPDFIDLGKRFNFFAQVLSMDARGIAKINFNDKNALRALSRALLMKDFSLNVNIPEHVLVPTIPLRLNYILWIEDLVSHYLNELADENDNEKQVRGIDIGTGATAIYALIGARKNKWQMTGTEINPEHAKTAQDNVVNNKLLGFVTIVPVNADSIFGSVLSGVDDGHYNFCMCNPPFFASDEETDSVGKGRFSPDDKPLRPPPSGAQTGQGLELVAEGGELQFVKNMIIESLRHMNKIRIFTSMLGIKRHLKQLISFLREHHIWNFTTTEFTQGKTTRWGLAWSLHPKVSFVSQYPNLVFNFTNISTLLDFDTLIESYLNELKPQTLRWLTKSVEASLIEDEVDEKYLEFTATENNWSGQRRKRRELERLKKIAENELHEPGFCEPSPPKITKIDVTASSSSAPSDTNFTSMEEDKPVLIHCLIELKRESILTNVKLTMTFRDGILGKDGMNQIMQYLKNRFQKDLSDSNSIVCQMSSI